MKRITLSASAILIGCMLLVSCNTATPETYFDQAVLNSNLLVGFAGKEPLRELAYPSAKMDANNKTVAMPRMEMIQSKIEFAETSLEKIKDLKETPDTKEILQTSKALYEYVLPVYKTAYTELAKLYDDGASKTLIEAKAHAIHEAHYARYDELYSKLISQGKLFAARHSIKVNWEM